MTDTDQLHRHRFGGLTHRHEHGEIDHAHGSPYDRCGYGPVAKWIDDPEERAEETPMSDSATRLEEAISQHPQLWTAMGHAWERRMHDGPNGWAAGAADFAVRCMCIVGGFDQILVSTRLDKEFG